ncbi:thioredoxin family protein [Nostocoides sp. HKS02]|uniref:thioredoxin family protein n=1 Tax=Nostocoides sp. HKS02 TaxID=1813880 RepID=UPI0018A7FD14|nr:thioredoxin family protein [Tetrasphaera sp. HKS02]
MSDTTTKVRRRTAGDDAPSISLPDSQGQTVSADYSANAATVVVFTSNGCPYALAWHDRIQQIAMDYDERGVQLVQIVSNDGELQPKDSLEGMRVRVAAGEVAGTYLKDVQQSVTASFGATATPEVFVVDADGVIRYHGAPDGNHDDPTQDAKFVRDALESVLVGEPVHRPTTSPAGCSVKWRVELLWYDGCPSHGAAETLLTECLTEIGRTDVRVDRVQVSSPEQAASRSFPGSPTFQVGGSDLFAVDAPSALACRTYQHPDGRISPLPSKEDLIAQLRDALARPWDLPGWHDFRAASRPTAGA